MSEWREYKLGDIAEVKGGKRLPKGDLLVDYETPHPYIRVTDLGKKWVRKTGLQFVTPEIQKSISRYTVNSGNIILSIVGSIGFVGRISDELDGANLTENCVKFLTNKKVVDDDFLFYYLISNIGQEEIEKRNVGSTQPKLPIYNIKDIDILIPPLPEQIAIASILSSLDDKIDLLHRQNATLEKMAETLFRQWFVERESLNYDSNDFYDGHEFKNQGNQPNQKNQGSDNVEEAKEEWEMGKVSDFALHFKDSIQPQKNQSTLYFHYSIPSFDNGKNPIKELGKEIQSNKYKVPEYCMLFSKLNPHKDKRVWLIQNEVEENSICSTEFQIVLPKKKQHLYFLYGWLTLNDNYNEIASGVGGTSGSHQRIDPNTIYDFQCPIVAETVIENFSIQIEPVFKKQVINETQIRTLTALRDTLLPKLMSGEVRVL